ncbi:M6 family metalloprotease domain-containing protein [Nonomuraea jiangxiensis]|uniref:M6 family metalloprotease domain-containing protein n=1 Tax=Nonomuraea jiangxiensis TaxID=633440 RepID=A0A1G8M1J9_9ACTN|nr:M6 family metalloprotease domain-containing protein [Nonomuraea jiangxiensis]
MILNPGRRLTQRLSIKSLAVFGTLVLGVSLSTAQTGQAATMAFNPPALQPIDPQRVQDQQDMTWQDYKPIPGVSWATNGAIPTDRALRVALVAVDFPNQPFVITQPKKSDPFGNPQIEPITRDKVPQFYADFFNKPSPVNNFQTINGYWMEQSGGKIGIPEITAYGPYELPKDSFQYGLNDIGQEQQQGCPSQTTVTGNQSAVTTIEVKSTKFLKVGDVITITGVSPSGRRVVTGIPDSTHLTLDGTVTVTDGAGINNCAGTRLETDADALWHADANCTGNCGYDVVLRIYAGYDETSVWQEFGEMKFNSPEDVPREVWGNPNPEQPTAVRSRYVPWTSWLAGSQLWGQSTVRQGESSGTITHELSHFFFSIGDNNNNPYAQPYHRAGSGTWDMMDRGSFNGPGGPHNRWQVPAQQGASMGAEQTLRNKIGMGFVPYSSVARFNRDGLAKSGLAVVDVIARAVNTSPLPVGSRAGLQVLLDGNAPADRSPACDVNTNPLCDGGGPAGGWSNYTLETVQRIGYGSFQPDNGVLIAKNKPYEPGQRGKEGSTCGYNCFTWVVDAHPEDIDQLDYVRPDGTKVMRTIGDYRQLNDALFHAGTNSGSKNEYVDASNGLHFYILDKYEDDKGFLHYVLGVQNPAGAGPQKRGVALEKGTVGGKAPELATYCSFRLTNTGKDAATDPALHPQDERAQLRNDVYRLSASASSSGWAAQLPNNLTTAAFGKSVDVPVFVTRTPVSAGSTTIQLTATSVSNPGKAATASCKVKTKDTDH